MRNGWRVVLVIGMSATAGVAQEDLLRGPEVRTDTPPGVVERFGGGQGERGAMAERVPMHLFVRALRPLAGEEAGEHRLSPEQGAQLREIGQEYRAAMEAYLKERGVERGMQRGVPREMQRGEGRGRGGAEAMSPEERERRREGMEQVRDALAGAPDPAPYQRRMWSVLTEPQRALAGEALERARAERRERGEAMGERVLREQGGAEQARDAIRRLTPAQREALRERQSERRRLESEKNRGGEGRTPKGGSPSEPDA